MMQWCQLYNFTRANSFKVLKTEKNYWPFSSRTVAYWLFARGQSVRLQSPVKLYSLRQNFCPFVLQQTSHPYFYYFLLCHSRISLHPLLSSAIKKKKNSSQLDWIVVIFFPQKYNYSINTQQSYVLFLTGTYSFITPGENQESFFLSCCTSWNK